MSLHLTAECSGTSVISAIIPYLLLVPLMAYRILILIVQED